MDALSLEERTAKSLHPRESAKCRFRYPRDRRKAYYHRHHYLSHAPDFASFWGHIAPLLAFGSIGAASLGFAGKDVIANFCSGLMLHITRPFVIGDEIMLPEKNLEGNIEEIGWFKTSIRDKEKRAVYLPNNFF